MSALDPRFRAVDGLLCRWADGKLPAHKATVVNELLERVPGWVRHTVLGWYCRGAERTREFYRERMLALSYVLGALASILEGSEREARLASRYNIPRIRSAR